MTMQTEEFTSPTRTSSLKRTTLAAGRDSTTINNNNDGNTSTSTSKQHANINPNSYLKSRRLPAKQQRRGKILSILDSSIEDVDYKLPDFSDVQGPFVPLVSSQSSHKRKTKSKKTISSSSYHSTTSTKKKSAKPKKNHDSDCVSLSSLGDQQDMRPMDEVLRSLHASGLTDNSDSTSYTDTTSLASIGFNMSSQHTSSFASLFGDDDGAANELVDFEGDQEKESSSTPLIEAKHDRDRIWSDDATEACSSQTPAASLKESMQEKMSAVREPDEMSAVEYDEVSASSASYYEEEYIEEDDYIEEVYSDSEETIEEEEEEEYVDEDELLYDEIIVEEQGQYLDNNGDISFVDEPYYSDEDEFVEEFIFEEESLEEEYDEYIIGEEEYQASKFEASLGIIEEEDDDQSASYRSRHRSIIGRLDSAAKTESFVEEEDDVNFSGFVDEEEILYSEDDGDDEVDYPYEDEEGVDVYYEAEDDDDDDESYIEEEIIPHFEVPVIPAIAIWQELEKERALVEDEEPPEIAPRTPRNILMAVLAASAADFKLRKVPNDHKKRFVPISEQAACLARLTKLNENVVEAMGRASLVKKEDDWRPTGAPITLLRSLNLRIVTEAAAMGRVMRLKEKVVTNYEDPKLVFGGGNGSDSKLDIDDMVDDKGHRIFRTSVLVPRHEQDVLQGSMSRDWNLGFLEASTEADETTVENVKLPTERIPRFTKPPSCSPVMSRQEIHDSIARGVAEGAWDRKYRLERPHIGLRITSMCRCRYCENPNAYQTHAYKKLSQRTHSM